MHDQEVTQLNSQDKLATVGADRLVRFGVPGANQASN